MAGWRVNALLSLLPLRSRRRKWSSRCGCTFLRLESGQIWQVVWCPRHNPFDFGPAG
jgi:hypothetical protein